jgi:hypothetical protein
MINNLEITISKGDLMKLFFLFFLTLTFGCSTSSRNSRDLEKRVEALEVYSLKELEQHTQILLETHPELTPQGRKEVKELLEQNIQRFQELRRREAQLIQSLLANSLSSNERGPRDLQEEKQLKKILEEIYEQKHKNTLKLVSRIAELRQKKLLDEGIQKDLNLILRELR